MPTAVNNVTLSALFDDIAGNVMIACPIMIIFAIVVTIIILLILLAREDWERKQGRVGISDRTKAVIISISFISFGKILLFIGLDAGALLHQMNYLDESIKDILYNDDQMASNILKNIPRILLVLDLFALILGITMILICPCIYSMYFKSKNYTINDFKYYCFAVTVIPLIIGCLNHAPYIMMAYVSDSSYASSIFVYYLVALFVEFGIIQYVFRACYLKQTRHMKKNYLYCTFCRNYTWKRAFIFTVIGIILSILVNGTMIAIFLFFYYIPISYVLSNAPSQAVLIYQSAIILVGGYITYKTTFERDRHTNQHRKYDNMITARQIKEDEIAFLEKKITVSNHEGMKTFLKEQIAHRQAEILLATLHERIICVLDDTINPVNTCNLHSQQNEAIEYLLTEIKTQPSYHCHKEDIQWLVYHEQNEKEHLKNEIFGHLQKKLDQIWREPNKSDKIRDFEKQISGLPGGDNKAKLNEMFNHLKDSFNIKDTCN